jgi:hypothetical protein
MRIYSHDVQVSELVQTFYRLWDSAQPVVMEIKKVPEFHKVSNLIRSVRNRLFRDD